MIPTSRGSWRAKVAWVVFARLLLPEIASASVVRHHDSAPVLINEVLFDPEGPDAGREYVELAPRIGFQEPQSLEGWRLETGNGATGSWSIAWIGSLSDTVSEGVFVIGESFVEPPPDAVASLDLQNGPDACRLVSPDGQVDVVGWGTPLPADFFEGVPVSLLGAGALARFPDAWDEDDNSRDFRVADPSPGVFNAPEISMQVIAFEAPPVDHAVGAAWRFRWQIRSEGRLAGPARAFVLCRVHPEELLAFAEQESLAPGEVASLEARVSPPPGLHEPVPSTSRELPLVEGEIPPWRGHGLDLRISEVMSRPESDHSEWIEVEVLAPNRVSLEGAVLVDRGGTSGTLAGEVRAHDYVILVADSTSFRRRWSTAAPVLQVSPWPSLNHTATAGVAEELTLLRGSAVWAHAAFPEADDAGVSLEMLSRSLDPSQPQSWAASLDPRGGTPGEANSRRADRFVAADGRALQLSANSFDARAQDNLVIVWRHPVRVAPAISVYDMAGRRVVELTSWSSGGAEYRAVWDGRNEEGEELPRGLYLVRAEAERVREVQCVALR